MGGEPNAATFRYRAAADGATAYPAAAGRYHLYVSLACPWAHRTLIFRTLKQLEDVISVSIVDPVMEDDGWEFSEGPGCIGTPGRNRDRGHGARPM